MGRARRGLFERVAQPERDVRAELLALWGDEPDRWRTATEAAESKHGGIGRTERTSSGSFRRSWPRTESSVSRGPSVGIVALIEALREAVMVLARFAQRAAGLTSRRDPEPSGSIERNLPRGG